jgi:hypothetical protein
MVEAKLVTNIWPEVQSLLSLLEILEPALISETLFLNDDGEWRLVCVVQDVDRLGTRPIYAVLDEQAQKTRAEFSLLSRLVLLDPGDEEARQLMYGPTSAALPPRDFRVALASLPGYLGANVRLKARSGVFAVARILVDEVEAVLRHMGLDFERDIHPPLGPPNLWADFVVRREDAYAVLVEAKISDPKNARNRINDAAGMANLTGLPIVLVVVWRGELHFELESPIGIVPVYTIDWLKEGPDGLINALRMAIH